ncbi:MAG: 2-amino-4-hydroxy-6-hydroxymethyldihydropteridine diphosphokinase [Gammaproteobacteria bacterium]
MLQRAYISIGSNIEPQRHIRLAVQALREVFGALDISPVYESEAVGFKGDNFYNLVVGLATDMSVGEVNSCLHAIEDRYGRERQGPRFSSRSIDLDLLLYNDLNGVYDGVLLPREEIPHHAHVLCPLADLIPAALHPVLNKSYQQLWQDFAAPSGFQKLDLRL